MVQIETVQIETVGRITDTASVAYLLTDWPAFAPDRHPDTLAWIARIEGARLEDAPVRCPTCGGSALGRRAS